MVEFTKISSDLEGQNMGKFQLHVNRVEIAKLVIYKVKIPTPSVNPEKHGFERAYIKIYYHRLIDKDEKASLTKVKKKIGYSL